MLTLKNLDLLIKTDWSVICPLSRVCLFFPPRVHEPPPTLRDRLNRHLSLQRRRGTIFSKRFVGNIDWLIRTETLLLYTSASNAVEELFCRCLSLLLAVSSRVYILFPPRGHKPPPTLRDRLNRHLSLQRRRRVILSKRFVGNIDWLIRTETLLLLYTRYIVGFPNVICRSS